MKFSDSIREGVTKKKSNRDSKDDVRKSFNDTTLKLINRFIEDVEVGNVEVTDVSDFAKIYNMYLSLNELEDGGGGTGQLPELPREQVKLLGDSVEKVEGYGDDEDEPEEYIKDDSFASKSPEEIAQLLEERERKVNKSNEEAF